MPAQRTAQGTSIERLANLDSGRFYKAASQQNRKLFKVNISVWEQQEVVSDDRYNLSSGNMAKETVPENSSSQLHGALDRLRNYDLLQHRNFELNLQYDL